MNRILVVEDDQLIAHNIGRALGSAGYQVAVAHTAADGLKMAQVGEPFDLLLLDIGLPDGSGVDLARELRRRKYAGPLIFLTAYADEVTVQAAIQCNSHAYLVKPVTTRQLLPLIESALATLMRQAQQHEQMTAAIVSNRIIGTAVGMLAERWQCPPESAFEMLRRRARQGQTKLDLLAQQIVAGESDLSQ